MINTKEICKENLNVYLNLAQAYEAEFSSITGKLPTKSGVFEPDTMPDENHKGFLLFDNEYPIGFCITKVDASPHDICEFYIIPAKRKKNFGYKLAKFVFEKYPGQWQVRQIVEATAAISFWRRIISQMTNDNYDEEVVDDLDWGKVLRQHFFIPKD